MIELPTLYGYDSKKRIKEWSITVNGDEITISHGLMDGKMTSKTNKVKGKNIGRANETSPEEQALKEAQAKWKKQKDKSYCEDIDNIQGQMNPMLAKTYDKFDGPYWVQPKLDGVRAVLKWTDEWKSEVELKSRGGKSYPVPPHMKSELFALLVANEDNPVDGELYIHGKPLNEIVSAAKKHNDLTPELEFHVFDSCKVDEHFDDRFQQMIDDVGFSKFKSIKLVETTFIYKESSVDTLHDRYVADGYEGLILRKPNSLYMFDQRSSGLVKYKKFIDDEWEIFDVVPDKDGHGKIICYCPEAVDTEDFTFGVTLGSMSERDWQLANKDKIIGKALTVKYQAKTKHNKPQFGVGVAIRDGKFVDGEFFPDN